MYVTAIRSEPITVLVADDDTDVRCALAQLVASYDTLRLVDAVADGASAGESAGRHRPQVAVVDVGMPGGGVAAIRAIHEVSSETAVVVYTASGDPGIERAMRDAGACMFVVKGDRRTQIVAAIAAAGAGAARVAPPNS